MMLDASLQLCSNDPVVHPTPQANFTWNPIGGLVDLSSIDSTTFENDMGVFMKVRETLTCVTPLGFEATFCGFALVATNSTGEVANLSGGQYVVGQSEPFIGSDLASTPWRTLPTVGEEIFFRVAPPRQWSAVGTNPTNATSYKTFDAVPRRVGLVVWYAGTALVPSGQDPSFFRLTAGRVDAWLTDRVPTIQSIAKFSDFN